MSVDSVKRRDVLRAITEPDAMQVGTTGIRLVGRTSLRIILSDVGERRLGPITP